MNESTDPATLTKAVLRAAEHLGLLHVLPEILEIDPQQLSKMIGGAAMLDRNGAEWTSATRFTGLFRSLVTLLGDSRSARLWLTSSHQTLGAAPAELLRSSAGRERVYRYLDAVQKYEIKLPPRSEQH
jgi:hypothetical protein